MARQYFAAKKAQNSRPKAFHSSKGYENNAAKQHKASQHRCADLKASHVVTADVLLRAWFFGPASMYCVHMAVCKSLEDGHGRQQDFDAEWRRLLKASVASSKQCQYKPKAQVNVVKEEEPSAPPTNMQLSYKLPSYIHLLAQCFTSYKLQAFKADIKMRKTFRSVSNALQPIPLASTHKSQLLQLLSTCTLQLAQHIPTSYNIMRVPKSIPTYSMQLSRTVAQVYPAHHMQLVILKLAPTSFIAPNMFTTFNMLRLLYPANSLQLAVPTACHHSLQCSGMVTHMALSSSKQQRLPLHLTACSSVVTTSNSTATTITAADLQPKQQPLMPYRPLLKVIAHSCGSNFNQRLQHSSAGSQDLQGSSSMDQSCCEDQDRSAGVKATPKAGCRPLLEVIARHLADRNSSSNKGQSCCEKQNNSSTTSVKATPKLGLSLGQSIKAAVVGAVWAVLNSGYAAEIKYDQAWAVGAC